MTVTITKTKLGKAYSIYNGNRFQRVIVSLSDGSEITKDIRVRIGHSGMELYTTAQAKQIAQSLVEELLQD